MKQPHLFSPVLLLCFLPAATATLPNLFPIIGFLPSVIINTFFSSFLTPVTDELCFDFIKQFQLQELATCTCTGGVNANLGFWGKGVCTTTAPEVCFDNVCGTVTIYPSVVTERINFIPILQGNEAEAVDHFDLTAQSVWKSNTTELIMTMESVGSIDQCLVQVTSASATLNGNACLDTSFAASTPTEVTCRNNENIVKSFTLDCPGTLVDGTVDITLQTPPL